MHPDAIICCGLRKRFKRYSGTRPRRFKDFVFGGWREWRRHESLWALRNVSFRVARGQMLGIVGRNGAGKSTLLRLIGGVGEVDGGFVEVRGRTGALLNPELGFHPDLTGRENAFISGVMGGLTRREVKRRLDRIVAFAELEEFLDAPLRTYSTGMRMRLGFSIAAHSDPDVLLIDEILSVGDLAFQRKCMDRIAECKRQGTTVLLVSHNTAEVEKLCDHVLWLENGRVRAFGETHVVLDEYKASSEGVLTSSNRIPDIYTASTGEPLRLHENRIGTLEMEISSVNIGQRTGSVPPFLKSGHPLEVYIAYLPHEPIPSPIFQVKLIRDGVICWEGNTVSAGVTMPDIQDPGAVRLTLERQDLAEGDYYVEVGAYKTDWSSIYDYHFRVYPLRVVSPRHGEGVLDLPSRWELLQEYGFGAIPEQQADREADRVAR